MKNLNKKVLLTYTFQQGDTVAALKTQPVCSIGLYCWDRSRLYDCGEDSDVGYCVHSGSNEPLLTTFKQLNFKQRTDNF